MIVAIKIEAVHNWTTSMKIPHFHTPAQIIGPIIQINFESANFSVCKDDFYYRVSRKSNNPYSKS